MVGVAGSCRRGRGQADRRSSVPRNAGSGTGSPVSAPQELDLSEHELVITRTELDALHDDLYVLACAVEDTERDLAAIEGQPTAAELRGLLDWLLESARPLSRRDISASASSAQ